MTEIQKAIKERIKIAPVLHQSICRKCGHNSMAHPRHQTKEWHKYAVRMICTHSYMLLPSESMVYAPNDLGYYIMQPANAASGTSFEHVVKHGVYRPNKKAFVPDSCPYKLEHILETKS